MSYNKLSFGLLRNKVLDNFGIISKEWVRWVTNALVPAINNTTPISIPGPFVNDAAAATGGVPLLAIYYDASGVPHVRIV